MQILNQDILNLIVLGMREQGTPAINHADYSRCEYLTDDGRRCVVGMLIPDQKGGEFEGTVFEQGRDFWDLMNKFGVQKTAHSDFLEWLQGWHDDIWPIDTDDTTTPQRHMPFTSSVVQRSLEEYLTNWNEDTADQDDQVSLKTATRFALAFEKGLRNAHQG